MALFPKYNKIFRWARYTVSVLTMDQQFNFLIVKLSFMLHSCTEKYIGMVYLALDHDKWVKYSKAVPFFGGYICLNVNLDSQKLK